MRSLKLLYQDFLDFVYKDFHPKAYALTILIVVSSIWVVYSNTPVLGWLQGPHTILSHFVMYLSLYSVVTLINVVVRKTYSDLRNPWLYVKVVLFMGLLAVVDAFSWRQYIDLPGLASLEKSYIYAVLWRSRNAMFILPVLILLRLFFDKHINGLYGLSRGNHHVRAYLLLYCIIFPLLLFASFTPDFLSYYPSYEPWGYGWVFGRPIWLNTLIYEVVYMFDFVMVELFFRGALVIGMAALLGRKAVLSMVAVYVALHFGKPALETISAMFGGFALGALAYQTRHIWGGVIIHMGIALTIELLRFFQFYVLEIG